MPLAQARWTGLVNVPVGATSGGLVFGLAAGADIDQRETAPGTPAKADGSTGFSQSGFDNQRLFVKIYMLLPSLLVISSGMGAD